MEAQPVAVTLDVFRIALASREGFVLAEELVRGGLKALAAPQLSSAML